MGSPVFGKLSESERDTIRHELYKHQEGICYICGDPMELTQPLDIDHMRSTDQGGPDSKNNWGLTHAHCNRSKGNRDLDLLRYLSRFAKARRMHLASGQAEDSFTLGVALALHGGAQKEAQCRRESDGSGNEFLVTTWDVGGKATTVKQPIHVDPNNLTVRSFTALIPVEYAYHDGGINPRSIVDLDDFIEEFYRGHPQLLPSLAHLILDDMGKGRIFIFDGQHKAAAQVFLGNRVLYLRVFVEPDRELLKATNFGAHTKLAQLHFPMAIQDKVGYDIFTSSQEAYLNGLSSHATVKENSFFKTLAPEDKSEMRAHFRGYLRFRVVATAGSESGTFFDYVETVTARSKTKPLAYETVRKALFNAFLCLYETDTPIDLALAMRDRERDNLARLLRLFAEKVLVGAFNLQKGIFKIEENLATDQSIQDPHLRAYRLCRQAPLIIMMRELHYAIADLLSLRQRYSDATWKTDQVLWAEMQDDDWLAIGKMLDRIVSHKVWIERNPTHAKTVQDTRQGTWEDILVRGKFPGAVAPIYDPLNRQTLLASAT